MDSELSWYFPGKAMRLRISGDYPLESSLKINSAIIEELEKSQGDLTLLIDATEMNRPYNFDQIRGSQSYMDHQNLRHICIVTRDRLVKLAMMVIFNTSRAQLHMFDNVQKVDAFLHRHINASDAH
jgi:hypothetical protein